MRLSFNAQWPFILAGIVLLAAFGWQSLRAGQPFAGGGGHIRSAGAAPGALRILRAAAVACMVFCLLEPVLFIMETSMPRARLAVLVDASVSMKQSGKTGESRWSAAVKWLSDNARPIEKLSDPVYFYFTDKIREFDPRQAPVKTGAFMPAEVGLRDSNLDMALEQLMEKTACRPERIWVITDGLSQAENTGVDESVPVPVDFIGAGESSRSPGIKINRVRYPDFAFLHLPLKISVLWEAHRLAGSRVRIRLEREDSTVVARKSEVLKSDYQELESTLTARTDGLGSERWRLVISAKGAKPVSREMRFQVIREKWRIMYLCGKPSPEYANLREFLKADPNLELVSFVILRNPEDVSPVPDIELALIPFPAREIFVRDIHHFDILILQNFSFRRFNLPHAYLSSVRDFVNRGGGLMVIGGDSAFASGYYRGTPLERALPVVMLQSRADYRPDFLRVEATDHPVARLAGTPEESRRLWKDVPPLKGFNRFAALKKGAWAILKDRSVKTGEAGPVLAAWEYGKGKVMVMASPSTWRWKMSAGYSWKMSPFYFSFWTRVLQYLSGSLDLKRVQLAAPPQEPVAGEVPTVVLRVLDETFNPLNDSSADIRAYWTLNSGKSLSLEFRMTQAGIFKASLSPPYYGSQKIHAVVKSQGRAIGEDEVKFRMNRPSEKASPVDRAGLESLARRTGGRYSSIYSVDVGKWLKDLPEQEKGERIRSRKNLRDFTFWLALVSVLLLSEWFLRRLWGFS